MALLRFYLYYTFGCVAGGGGMWWIDKFNEMKAYEVLKHFSAFMVCVKS
jgi:hypothetical protein